jgi:hypothetical protein
VKHTGIVDLLENAIASTVRVDTLPKEYIAPDIPYYAPSIPFYVSSTIYDRYFKKPEPVLNKQKSGTRKKLTAKQRKQRQKKNRDRKRAKRNSK